MVAVWLDFGKNNLKRNQKTSHLGLGKDHWIKISMLNYVTSASLQITDQPKD